MVGKRKTCQGSHFPTPGSPKTRQGRERSPAKFAGYMQGGRPPTRETIYFIKRKLMAETQDGAMHFKASLDNSKLISAIEETVRRINGLSDATVKSGATIDSSFSQMAAEINLRFSKIDGAVNIHKEHIAALRKEYEEIGRTNVRAPKFLGDSGYSTERQRAIRKEVKEREALVSALEKEADALAEAERKFIKHKEQVERNAAAHNTLRARIRELREEMASLIDRGVSEQSAAYRALADELGRLQDIQGDVAQQGRILSNDEAGFQGIIAGVSGLGGALSAATGAMSLFAGENDHLQRVMAKVQSAMAIAIGTQQVAQTLNKDSAFQLVTLNKLKKWWAEITEKATAVKKAEAVATAANTAANEAEAAATTGNVAAKAADSAANVANAGTAGAAATANWTLAASFRAVGAAIASLPGVGWVIAGVTALVAVFAHLIEKSKEARRAQEEMAKAVADGASKSIASVTSLRQAYIALGNDMEAKKRFIEDNRDAFRELGVSVTSVRDAENLLIHNTQAFVASEMAKARASAHRAKLVSDTNKMIENEEKIKNMPDEVPVLYGGGTGGGMWGKQKNKDKYDLIEENKRLGKSIAESAVNEQAEILKSFKALEDAGIKGVGQFQKGTVGAIEKSIAVIQDRIKDMVPGSKEWTAAQKELTRLQGLISPPGRGSGKGGGKGNKDKEKAEREALEAFKTDVTRELDRARTILDVLKTIEERRNELKNDKSEAGKEKLKFLDEKQYDATKEARRQEEALLQSYISYYDRKIALDLKYNDDIALLDRRRLAATTEAEREQIERAKQIRTEKYEKDKKTGGDDEYSRMLKDYGSFEQRKQAIIDEYADRRKRAQEHGNEELAASLDKMEAKSLSDLASKELTGSDMWAQLFGNLDELTTSQIEVLIQEIESRFKELSGIFDPVDLAKIRAKLNEARDVLTKDNPFKQMGEALREIFNSAGEDSAESAEKIKRNWKKLGKATEKSFQFVRDAVDSSSILKDALGEVGETAISSLQTVAVMAVSVAAAIAAAEKASIILTIIQAALAVVQAVANVIGSIISSKNKQIEKEIKRHAEAVENLKRAYNGLQHAISRALGTDTYTKQKEAIENLKEQKKHLEEMIKLRSRSAKKKDKDAVIEYKEQIEQIDRDIDSLLDSMKEDLLQTDAKSFADELGDALVEAFGKGESSAKAFEKTVNSMLQNMVKNMLKKRYLEKQVSGVLDGLADFMDKGGTPTDQMIEATKTQLEGIAENYSEKLKTFDKLFKTSVDDNKTLTGAVKGVTEQTASVVAGQLNAMRMVQKETAAQITRVLFHLAGIDRHTAETAENTKHLKAIHDRLMRQSSSDPLRAKGMA